MGNRLATMGAAERVRNCDAADAMDTSETLPQKRNRAMEDAGNNSDGSPMTPEHRCHVGEVHLAFTVNKDIVKDHAQLRNPEMKAHWDATHAFAVDGVSAAISA